MKRRRISSLANDPDLQGYENCFRAFKDSVNQDGKTEGGPINERTQGSLNVDASGRVSQQNMVSKTGVHVEDRDQSCSDEVGISEDEVEVADGGVLDIVPETTELADHDVMPTIADLDEVLGSYL